MLSSILAYRPFSQVQPVAEKPLSKQSPTKPPVAEKLRPSGCDSVQFGWGYYPDYSIDLDPQAKYYSGFWPDASIEDIFKLDESGRTGLIIDSVKDLKDLWQKLGMPKEDLPNPNWKKEVVVLVAREVTTSVPPAPVSMSYSRNRNILEIKVQAEKRRGRNRGTAWYVGILPNGGLTDEERKRGRSPNTGYWYTMDSRRTRVFIREVTSS